MISMQYLAWARFWWVFAFDGFCIVALFMCARWLQTTHDRGYRRGWDDARDPFEPRKENHGG